MSEPAIRIDHVSKRFHLPPIPKQATLKDLVVRRIRHDGQKNYIQALDDVSLTVEPGQRVGIIGRNGSGKTTLLRVMAGIVRADTGTAVVRGTAAPLLQLGAGFQPMLSGRENARIELLTLGLTRAQVDAVIERTIDFSEIREFIDMPVRIYSTGMAMRLAFAVAVSVDPDVLLIDEALAVGDEAFARKCATTIDEFHVRGKTTVLVTHDAAVLLARCDAAVWLDNGRIAGYGTPSEVVAAYHHEVLA